MVLYLAYRYERSLFYPFFPLIVGPIVSTVYLKYHCVIDLIVGAVIAAGCLPIAPRLHAWWDKVYEVRPRTA
jgi:membrane-associated phospholipid phosphatase